MTGTVSVTATVVDPPDGGLLGFLLRTRPQLFDVLVETPRGRTELRGVAICWTTRRRPRHGRRSTARERAHAARLRMQADRRGR